MSRDIPLAIASAMGRVIGYVMGFESRPTKSQTKQEIGDADDIIVATRLAPLQGVEGMVLSSDNVLLFSRWRWEEFHE